MGVHERHEQRKTRATNELKRDVEEVERLGLGSEGEKGEMIGKGKGVD